MPTDPTPLAVLEGLERTLGEALGEFDLHPSGHWTTLKDGSDLHSVAVVLRTALSLNLPHLRATLEAQAAADAKWEELREAARMVALAHSASFVVGSQEGFVALMRLRDARENVRLLRLNPAPTQETPDVQ